MIYFADFSNQYGSASPLLKKITEAALKSTKDIRAMFEATKSLTPDYIPRREKVYKAVMALNLRTGAGTTANSAGAEATANNAEADGIISDKAYWIGVMSGDTVPSPQNIKKLLDNIHGILKLTTQAR